MKREFTSSTYILEDNKVLLIFHKKLQKWLPPGGHIDPNETPPEAAVREAFEETGLHIEIIPQENIWVDESNACSIERPYLCLLQEIPEYKGVPAHQHIDMVFISRPVNGRLLENPQETDGIRWFSWEEVSALKSDNDIFTETKSVIRTLLCAEVYV